MASVTAILWLWAISIFNILVGGLAFLLGSSETSGGSLSDVASGIATSSLGFTMMQFGAFTAVVALLAHAISASISENQAVIHAPKPESSAQRREISDPEPQKGQDKRPKTPEDEAYRRMYGIE